VATGSDHHEPGRHIIATASLAANVPACLITAQGADGGGAMPPVPADPPPPTFNPPESTAPCFRLFEEAYEGHDPTSFCHVTLGRVDAMWTPYGS